MMDVKCFDYEQSVHSTTLKAIPITSFIGLFLLLGLALTTTIISVVWELVNFDKEQRKVPVIAENQVIESKNLEELEINEAIQRFMTSSYAIEEQLQYSGCDQKQFLDQVAVHESHLKQLIHLYDVRKHI